MAGRLQLLEKWIRKLSTNTQIEIIIIHDYWDQTTSNELREICQKYDGVVFIEGSFGNPGSARNAGLQICKGKWITFWDSDDEPIVDNFLALLMSIEATNPDVCFARFKVFNETSGLVSESPEWTSNWNRDLSNVAQNPGIWRVIFSRALIEGIRFEPIRMAEDQIFICEAVLKAKKLSFDETQVYTYFKGSEHHLTKNSGALQDLLPAFKKTSKMLKNSGVDAIPFLRLMVAKQLISGWKYGNLRTRFSLIVAFSRTKLVVSPMFVGALKTAILYSVRGV